MKRDNEGAAKLTYSCSPSVSVFSSPSPFRSLLAPVRLVLFFRGCASSPKEQEVGCSLRCSTTSWCDLLLLLLSLLRTPSLPFASIFIFASKKRPREAKGLPGTSDNNELAVY